MKKGVLITAGVFIVIGLLVVCLVPFSTVAYSVNVTYEDIETYSEEMPLDYDVTETHIDEHPNFVTCSRIVGMDFVWEEVKNVLPIAHVTVRNTDSVSGTFTVHFTFHPTSGAESGCSPAWEDTWNESLNLAPGEEKTAIYIPYSNGITKNGYSWEYEVNPGTKTIEKQRTVTRQRPETRYKKVTLLDYWLHY